MQTSIYYYTATGNSLYAAKTIAEKFDDCHMVSIPTIWEEKVILPAADRVGLIFPMYYGGIPQLVKQFIERLDLSKVQYIFTVVTCGNALFSGVMHELQKLLKAKGKTLNAGFYVNMVDTYLPIFTLPAEEKQRQIQVKADARISFAAEQIKNRRQEIAKEYFWLACLPIHKFWLSRFDKIDRKFTNSDRCTSCGQCARACPVDNIAILDGRPKWQHHCQECLACLHICPVQSIEFGRTQGKARYHHPQINWQEIIAAHLKS
jgi:NAD-dependent dihydropyrimidine dehydrogenase PreA subunit/flavodoxin